MGIRRYDFTAKRLGRRQMLRSAGIGGTGLWLAACSSSNNNKNSGSVATAPKATVAASAAPSAAATSASAATSAAVAASPTRAAAAASASPAAAAPTAAAAVQQFSYTNNPPDLKATPKKGGTFHYSSHVQAPNLDPVQSAAFESARIYTPVYNRLIRGQYGTEMQPYNPWQLVIKGDLAESWEHPDPLTYTLKLRQGVKFQNVAPTNGRLFTSADAKFTLDAFLGNPDTASQLPFTVVTPDANTVQLKLPKPANYALQALQDPRFVMLAKEIADADGDWKKRAVGTGPFILDDYQPNTKAHYKRNPDYYRTDRPYIDAIQIDNVKDNPTGKAAFISGQYEYADYTGSSPDDLKDILAAQKNTVVLKLQSRWQSNIFSIGFASDRDPWKDVRVRTAISKGFDRSVFGKKAYNGDYNVLGAYAWVGYFDSAPDLGDAYKFDPQAAKQMLTAAGVQTPLKAPLDYFTYSGDIGDQYQVIQQQLKDIGVDLQLNMLDYPTFLAKFYGGKTDNLISSFIPSVPRWPPLSMLALFRSGAPKNYLHVSSPEFDAAVDKLTTSDDAAEQKKAYQDAFNALMKPAYFLEIAEQPTNYFHSPKLHGLLPNMFTDPAGWGNQAWEDWWLEG